VAASATEGYGLSYKPTLVLGFHESLSLNWLNVVGSADRAFDWNPHAMLQLFPPVLAVEHVAETAVQPVFAGGFVVLAIDEFIEHVSVIPAEPRDFLP
jgi:hypothetical protein